jgi:hypothetical protein
VKSTCLSVTSVVAVISRGSPFTTVVVRPERALLDLGPVQRRERWRLGWASDGDAPVDLSPIDTRTRGDYAQGMRRTDVASTNENHRVSLEREQRERSNRLDADARNRERIQQVNDRFRDLQCVAPPRSPNGLESTRTANTVGDAS